MKTIAPDYYPHFRCIADQCRHSCCIGWEIDIDEDTFAYYQTVSGQIGVRLAENIDFDGEIARFRLTGEEERCPFLNERGLCQLILELGEESLCQICADHPRFRNFPGDREEIGLGMCCEAAAALILNREEPLSLITLEDDGLPEQIPPDRAAVLAIRDRAVALLTDRKKPLADRARELLDLCRAQLPHRPMTDWAGFFAGLERLDPAWDEMLAACTECAPVEGIPGEQLLNYFVYRHFAAAEEPAGLAPRAAFAVLSWQMISAIAHRDPARLPEAARMYSAEIEYSEENLAAVLAELGKIW